MTETEFWTPDRLVALFLCLFCSFLMGLSVGIQYSEDIWKWTHRQKRRKL